MVCLNQVNDPGYGMLQEELSGRKYWEPSLTIFVYSVHGELDKACHVK